jgi:hypothetical protein
MTFAQLNDGQGPHCQAVRAAAHLGVAHSVRPMPRETDMFLRLRQIALVARELDPAESLLTRTLGLDVCFRDVGVAKYGLHNALWALGGTFLEVVAPTQPNTAAGRYLDRRKGDGGYMYIVDCDDLDARRAHFGKINIRIVEDLYLGDDALHAEALHLHPRDTGGCLLSMDRHGPDTGLMGSYKWAGAEWRAKARADLVISGAAMQCADPAATAERWSEVLQCPLVARSDGEFRIDLDNAEARFRPVADDRGEGLAEVSLACKDLVGVLASAKTAGAPTGADWFDACGVRFRLAQWRCE